jgi:hypothetical protein
MKAFLMHPDRDFDLAADLPAQADHLALDLDLGALFDAMSSGDAFLRDVALKAVFQSLTDPGEIFYRQDILRDSLAHPAVVRELYNLAVDTLQGHKQVSGMYFFARSPESVLARSINLLEYLTGQLKALYALAEARSEGFRSAGFRRLFTMLTSELDDSYFEEVRGHLRQLRFASGVVMSAELGQGCKGERYLLHRAPDGRRTSWLDRVFGGGKSEYSFEIAERDEGGHQALADLRGRGVSSVANALTQSTDHILSFFAMLRGELGFYVGCLNLYATYSAKGEPTCIPVPSPMGGGTLAARGLYDACLALRADGRAVGNDLAGDGKQLIVITGANQGGKSTFLRSVGLAYLMMQCGMFVTAEGFSAALGDGVYTHFKRQEDVTLQSGKLDEELRRMSAIANLIRPRAVVLFNESFSSTNEREGSEIARQVVRALLDADVRVLFVTHLFELAEGLYNSGMDGVLFLRAERLADGRRTFRLPEGAPLPTSHGEDLYRRIFGA